MRAPRASRGTWRDPPDEQGRAYDHLTTLLAAQGDATAQAAYAARRAQDAAAAAVAAKTALEEQVEVARATPNLAARPGRSHHGLGLAVDLCGGVQSLGTAAHLWMQHNAPL